MRSWVSFFVNKMATLKVPIVRNPWASALLRWNNICVLYILALLPTELCSRILPSKGPRDHPNKPALKCQVPRFAISMLSFPRCHDDNISNNENANSGCMWSFFCFPVMELTTTITLVWSFKQACPFLSSGTAQMLIRIMIMTIFNILVISITPFAGVRYT